MLRLARLLGKGPHLARQRRDRCASPPFLSLREPVPVADALRDTDIVEAINLSPDNQMAIHTTDGCLTSNQIQQSGELGADDCASNSGCTVKELKPNSYGDDFNNAGGGVWATKFDIDGIAIWFWSVRVLGNLYFIAEWC